jgi:hypothetical protein
MAPTPPLSTLMIRPLLSGRFEKITNEIIEAVFASGLYQIRGVAVPASGIAQLKAGDSVPTYWRDGRPVLILAHNARRAGAVRRLGTATPAVEELFWASSAADGVGLYFRNDQQVTRLRGVSAVLGVKVPSRVLWGETDNTFLVVVGTVAPLAPAPAYHVFRLNRDAGQPLGATPAAATHIATYGLPSLTFSGKYRTVNTALDFPTPGCNVLGRFDATFPPGIGTGTSQLGVEYLTAGLDVLIPIGISATYRSAYGVLAWTPGIFGWLDIVSLKRGAVIWESPQTDAVWPGEISDCSFNGDQTLFSASRPVILAWDETDPTKQLVASTLFYQVYHFVESSGGDPPQPLPPVFPGDYTFDFRRYRTLIEDGAGTTIWDAVPWQDVYTPTSDLQFSAPTLTGLPRSGPLALRFLGFSDTTGHVGIVSGDPDGLTTKYVYVLDVSAQTVRQVASDTRSGNAFRFHTRAPHPAYGLLFIGEEASPFIESSFTPGDWPAATSRGHFTGPKQLNLNQSAAAGRDFALEEFEQLKERPAALPSPDGTDAKIAYHVVRTDDVKPVLPKIPQPAP